MTADSSGKQGVRRQLRRILGTTTVVCVGVGDAIGSGVFRTPGDIAALLSSPWVIMGFWLAAGIITFLQSLVTAELATRFPRTGGEYQYLKEAYGDFAAFFFGWTFSVFIVGSGAGTIAAAMGDFSADLFPGSPAWTSEALGCAGIVLVVAINAAGLFTGAVIQNILTVLKVVVLFAIAIGAMVVSQRWRPITPVASHEAGSSVLKTFLPALLMAFWPYTGATDSAKLAEEIHDVHRALPRALFRTVLLLTVIYLFYNFALLCALPPSQMAGQTSPHAMIFEKLHEPRIRQLILVGSVLICLGSLASMFLANIRVMYAMARDGLAFSFLGRMSKNQAPIAALLTCGGIACLFVLNRRFEEIMRIYFLGSALLFAMTYYSLIVFRRRDRAAGLAFPANAYRVPGGVACAVFLIILEIVIAIGIVSGDVQSWMDEIPGNNQYDSVYSLGLLATLAIIYVVWKACFRPTRH